MKTCKYCVNYNYKYRNCRLDEITQKLKLSKAQNCNYYAEIPNSLKNSRRCTRHTNKNLVEILVGQRLRENWNTKQELNRIPDYSKHWEEIMEEKIEETEEQLDE